MLAKNETDMQVLLDQLHNWCKRWRMLIDTDKPKVVHFRQGRRKRSEFRFKIDNNKLETTSTYKYLEVIFHEKDAFSADAEKLAKAGRRALGSLISKIHNLKEFWIKTYGKQFNACVERVMEL